MHDANLSYVCVFFFKRFQIQITNQKTFLWLFFDFAEQTAIKQKLPLYPPKSLILFSSWTFQLPIENQQTNTFSCFLVFPLKQSCSLITPIKIGQELLEPSTNIEQLLLPLKHKHWNDSPECLNEQFIKTKYIFPWQAKA